MGCTGSKDDRAPAVKIVENPQIEESLEKEYLEITETKDFAYVITFQSTEISLNNYFADIDEWKAVKGLNLFLKKVKPEDVKLALSYRHLDKIFRSGKYLTIDSLRFINKYKDTYDLEGIWIDVLCISPASQTLKQAFSYMGHIYSNAVVFPYWIEQPENSGSLNRAWIYQESRFSLLHEEFLSAYENGSYDDILEQLTTERAGVDDTEGVGPVFDCADKSTPSLNSILNAFLSCDVEYESDVVGAIFGVCEVRFSKLNDLHAGLISTNHYMEDEDAYRKENEFRIKITEIVKQRFLQFFGFSIDILTSKDIAIPSKNQYNPIVILFREGNDLFLSNRFGGDEEEDEAVKVKLGKIQNRKVIGKLTCDFSLIPPVDKKCW
jgi:hypothetical protein